MSSNAEDCAVVAHAIDRPAGQDGVDASVEVAVVHDYLTQRGGAERVVLTMMRAFPQARLHTALYAPEGTYPEYRQVRISTLPLNRLAPLRRRHRLGLPLYPLAFSAQRLSAGITLVSSSGWAHGIRTAGRKIVYCHAPARWLYQTDRYLARRQLAARGALLALRPMLRTWDRHAAGSADRYLTQSSAMRALIKEVYGIDAELLPAPHTMDPTQGRVAPPDVEPGFLLCVSRLLRYKNVQAVVEAMRLLDGHRLVVVGRGPEESRLRALAPDNTCFLGTVPDEVLRWLYANCAGLVAAAYEDYGLVPLEVAAFGRPCAALRAGGFLDTVVEGTTGAFFDAPEAPLIADAVRRVLLLSWDEAAIRTHADRFSEDAFIRRLREIVRAEAALLRRRAG
jgi:glycosyltransferase involved in cell wall biosynthesis